MVQIIILAAGRGTRFLNSDFHQPKPLIEWNGKRMVEYVIDNFKSKHTKILLVTRKEFELNLPNIHKLEIDYTTDGPATTANLLRDEIDSEKELIIVNCDQIILDWDENNFLNFSRKYDAVLGCFLSKSNKNSFVRLNEDNLVSEVKEKVVLSDVATNGLHYWKKAKYFFESYDEMLENKDTTNSEYYVAPSYNYLIKNGYKVGVFMFNQHHPIGTPEDLKKFIHNEKV